MKYLSRFLFVVPFLVASTLSADPPARVVRLNLTEGEVSFRPAGIDEWGRATVNRPLIDGDELWTEPGSRAEVHIGSAALRLGSSTSFGVIAENDRVAQLRLSTGTLTLRIRNVDEDAIWEVDTPNASVSLLRPGRYRIDVDPDGANTTVTTRGGEAEVTTADAAFAVHPGDQAIIPGADRPYDVAQAPSFDEFDDWCRNRDAREDRIASLRYVPRDLVGYEDLDSAGRWRFVAEYGWVWSPTVVVAGWAPYRYGHWAWVEPWGWTWIDDASWGFAPFHYGRWAYAAGGWFWVPGRIAARPVYAPALVAFGGGRGWSASISVGAVAWWPLAPGEVYVPGYAVGRAYVRNINASTVNVTNINVTNINVTQIHYANQRVAGGVTAVSQTNFVSARPVAASLVAVSSAQAASAAPIGMTAPLAPRPASVLGQAAASKLPPPPAVALSRAVVAKTPPPPPPVAFAAKQQLLVAHPGTPLTVAESAHVTATAPAARTVVRPLAPVTALTTTSGPAANTTTSAPARTGFTPTSRTVTTTPVFPAGTAAVTNTVGKTNTIGKSGFTPNARTVTTTTPLVQSTTTSGQPPKFHTTTSAPLSQPSTTTSGQPPKFRTTTSAPLVQPSTTTSSNAPKFRTTTSAVTNTVGKSAYTPPPKVTTTTAVTTTTGTAPKGGKTQPKPEETKKPKHEGQKD